MRTHERFDRPFDVDSVQAFHAARLLLLLRMACNPKTGIIYGRTKLAKLDFFIRYPAFLERALESLAASGKTLPAFSAGLEGIEATMVRYRFGPWDLRYGDYIAYLAARRLIRIGGGSVETYALTELGKRLADDFARSEAFRPITERILILATTLSSMSGTQLKEFVYATFRDEVVRLSSGRRIGVAR
jgi:hypothetical protein